MSYLRIRPFTGIALTTARESLRQPAIYLITAIAVVFIAALPFLITHILGDPARMIRDSALATQLMAGLLLGCQTASIAMSREIQKGTMSAVLSTPVDRFVFMAGKFAGLACIMLMYAAMTTIATLLALRTVAQPFDHDGSASAAACAAVLLSLCWAGARNFRSGASFAAHGFTALVVLLVIALVLSPGVTGIPQQNSSPDAWMILPVCANIAMAILLLSAMAITLSIRATFMPVMLMLAGILMIGLMSDYVLGRHASGHFIAALFYGLLPNWQHFWTVDALHLGTMTWAYTGYAGLYCAIYIALAITAGSLMLERMELKR